MKQSLALAIAIVAALTLIGELMPETSTEPSTSPRNSLPPSIHSATAIDIETIRCGNTKCFVTFATNSIFGSNNTLEDEGRKIGYIVAQENRTQWGNFSSKLDRAWMIASRLKDEYNASTLLLGPPETIWKNESFVDRLNNKTIYPYVRGPLKPTLFSAKAPLVVQKSLMMPEPNQFWHWLISKLGTNLNDGTISNFLQSHVADLVVLADNLYRELEMSKKVLDIYPCLCTDFQIIVDYKGHVHHLDLDRCFDYDRPTEEHDMQKMKGYINTLIEKYKAAIKKEEQALLIQ